MSLELLQLNIASRHQRFDPQFSRLSDLKFSDDVEEQYVLASYKPELARLGLRLRKAYSANDRVEQDGGRPSLDSNLCDTDPTKGGSFNDILVAKDPLMWYRLAFSV